MLVPQRLSNVIVIRGQLHLETPGLHYTHIAIELLRKTKMQSPFPDGLACYQSALLDRISVRAGSGHPSRRRCGDFRTLDRELQIRKQKK